MSSVGLFDALKVWDVANQIEAQAMPYIYPNTAVQTYQYNYYNVSREAAMGVPSLARARNLICNTIASLPMERWNSAGQMISKPAWMEQPDYNMPKATTIAWLVDSVLFYGVGYLQVTSVYQEDGRPKSFTWIDPRRITFDTTTFGNMVTRYQLDGATLPDSGVSSLVTFTGTDEGVLARASRTISAAIALEEAAYNMAKDPAPAVILKNTGADLTSEQIDLMLSKWKTARQNKSTAYLNNNIDATAFGFDPKNLQLTEARQYIAAEIARLMNVPSWVVSADSGDSMTYANVVENRKDFVNSLRGLISVIEDRLSMIDITPSGTYVRFSLDDFLRENAKERAEVLAILLQNNIITLEEARAKEGLSPRGDA